VVKPILRILASLLLLQHRRNSPSCPLRGRRLARLLARGGGKPGKGTRAILGAVLLETRVLAMLSLLPGFASAQSLCVPSSLLRQSGTSAYQFVGTLINSLAYAKAGSDRTQTASIAFERNLMTAQSGPEVVMAISAMIYEIKASDAEYRCAARLVQPYNSSDNEFIRTAAEAAHTVYFGLVQVDEDMIAELVSLLDDPGGRQTGTVINRLSDLGIKKAGVWKLLLIAGVAATYTLVDFSGREDEKPSRLSVTRAERAQLLQDLERSFGETTKQGVQAGQQAAVGAAAAIHKFLGDREWRSLDEEGWRQ
jgi:hypothetical protein